MSSEIITAYFLPAMIPYTLTFDHCRIGGLGRPVKAHLVGLYGIFTIIVPLIASNFTLVAVLCNTLNNVH